MKNVHSLNQDDVLSGDPTANEDDLSPSAFGDEVEETGASKKGGSKLVLFGGIGVAVLMVVFFAWKIFSPHFQGSQQQPPEGFDTLAAAPQQPAPPAPGAPQLLDPAAQPAPASGLVTHEPAPVPAAASGQPAAAAPAAPATAVQAAPASVQPAMASAAPAMQPQHVLDNLAQVNARIDNLERSIATIQDMVNKMAANASAKPSTTAATPRAQAAAPSNNVRPARVSSRYASDRAIAKKSNASSAEPSTTAARTEAREERAAPRAESVQRATLKAVLDGRAWFQTKSGDTLTVSVGEEVPGMGVVKSIDTDLGEVRFANGLSIR